VLAVGKKGSLLEDLIMAQWVMVTGTDGQSTWINLDRIAYMREMWRGDSFEYTFIYFGKDFRQDVKEKAEQIIMARERPQR
jgi:hypothetical protein